VKSWPTKDPDDVLDYDINWAPRLASGETIATSDWDVVEGDVAIEVSPAPSIVGAKTYVWLSGGTLGTACLITNHIVTSAGREWDQSVRLRIRSR
jgi:hypothetical protein